MSIDFTKENCETVLELHKNYAANQTAHYNTSGAEWATTSMLITLGGILTEEQLAFVIKSVEYSMNHADEYNKNKS